jgi:hypothetical protein
MRPRTDEGGEAPGIGSPRAVGLSAATPSQPQANTLAECGSWEAGEPVSIQEPPLGKSTSLVEQSK